jgi:hydantoinase/carbamoylase family amidase
VSAQPVDVTGSLAGDLAAAARIGASPGGGISRPAWSEELEEVTAWVARKLERLGLDVGRDAAGNLMARWPGTQGEAVMVASHLDTVPQAGAFDGALGVLAAVEAIRILGDGGFTPGRPILVGSFMDEEGTRFGTALFGSRAFCGEDLSAALASRDAGGVSVREAMARRGFDASALGLANRVAEVGAYVELHVEQGPVLDTRGLRLGVVEAICGIRGYRVAFRGEANHAGTTPMDARRDALALRERAMSNADLRATVGALSVFPAARNVIPGRCEFTIDLRSAVPEVFDEANRWVGELIERISAEENLEAEVICDYAIPPTAMSTQVTGAIEQAARGQGVVPLRNGERRRARRDGDRTPSTRRHDLRSQPRRDQPLAERMDRRHRLRTRRARAGRDTAPARRVGVHRRCG